MKTVKAKNIEIGKGFTVFGGPCSVETEEQLFETIEAIKDNIDIIRGGAFKPRSRPESFQGLGEKGLKILKKAGEKFGKPVITEVMDPRDIELVSSYADILQVGARNMYNYSLLKELGRIKKPVFLKRGISATVKEWLGALEYILKGGNKEVVLCERGIRTFEKETRFTLDLAGAFIARNKSERPVIIDPSHATGNRELIGPMVKAAKASGFDGVMVEVHFKPETAKSDAEQSLTPRQFNDIFNAF